MQHTKRVVLILGFIVSLMGLFFYLAAVLSGPPKEPIVKIEPVPENLSRGTVGLQVGQIYKYGLEVVVTAPDSLSGGKMIYWVDVNTRTTVR